MDIESYTIISICFSITTNNSITRQHKHPINRLTTIKVKHQTIPETATRLYTGKPCFGLVVGMSEPLVDMGMLIVLPLPILDGAVARSSANGLLGIVFATRYRFQPRADF